MSTDVQDPLHEEDFDSDSDSSEDTTILWVAVGIALAAFVILLGVFISGIVKLRAPTQMVESAPASDRSFGAETRFFS